MARQPQNGEPLGFGDSLWRKLRGSTDASEYERLVPGPVFLKYIDYSFGERRWLGVLRVGRTPDEQRPVVVTRATTDPVPTDHGK